MQAELASSHGIHGLTSDLSLLRGLGARLREADWEVTAIVEMDAWDRPAGPPRLIDLLPGRQTSSLYAVAIDIGTTTVSLYLVDLMTGQVVARSADYNGQITRGEDVISRIIYASQKPRAVRPSNNGHGKVDEPEEQPSRQAPDQLPNLAEMQKLVVGTINKLIQQVCRRADIEPEQIYKATVAGNPTMLHLFLGIPPESIRLAPYIPAVNHLPSLAGGANELGLGYQSSGHDRLPARRRQLRRRGHQRGRAEHRAASHRGLEPVHRRRHQRRDGAGQRRLADHLRLLGRAGLRGRGRPARHARHGRGHRGGLDQRRDQGTDLSHDRQPAAEGLVRVGADFAVGGDVYHGGGGQEWEFGSWICHPAPTPPRARLDLRQSRTGSTRRALRARAKHGEGVCCGLG